AGGGAGAGGTKVSCDAFTLSGGKYSVHIGKGAAGGAGGKYGYSGDDTKITTAGEFKFDVALAKGGGGGKDATGAGPGAGGSHYEGSKCLREEGSVIENHDGFGGGKPPGGGRVGLGGYETNAQAPHICLGQGNGGKGGDGGDRTGGDSGSSGHGGCIVITW
ncbi:hypothetical protein GT354_05970, partial [Streptomyces sp. SID3343]|nr:hypothetical protein [Streptomyces sp. SID3343]